MLPKRKTLSKTTSLNISLRPMARPKGLLD